MIPRSRSFRSGSSALPSVWALAVFATTVLPSSLVSPVIAQSVGVQNAGARVAFMQRDVADGKLATALDATVTLSLTNVPLADALDEITRQSGAAVMYSRTALPMRRRVTVVGTNITVGAALRQALDGTGVDVRLTPEGRVVLVTATPVVMNGAIVGKVINAKTKQPVIGATVTLDDATKGVVTSEDGTFRLTAPMGEHTLHVRGLGLVKQTRLVSVKDDMTLTVDFSLEPSASVLNEVVVTGSVVATERRAIPTPITVINAADIEKRGITRIDQLFRGEIPGVVAVEQGTKTYENAFGAMVSAKVYVRGASTIDGGANPLKTYVDGVEILDASYIGTIDPKSIERIEIVTGPQAATIYGSGAMGGVMQIFTKKGSGRTAPDMTLTLRSGSMESNMSGYTPRHDHSLMMVGGTGPEFSYSGTASYGYLGQWQPGLFSRTTGASIGATHTRGPVTASGSLGLTTGRNGTVYSYWQPFFVTRTQTGEFTASPSVADAYTRQIGTSASQTLSLNVDYRMSSVMQHHLTIGKSDNVFKLLPTQPRYPRPSDSLYNVGSFDGQRRTASYNTTVSPASVGGLSTVLTLGMTGSWSEQKSLTGCTTSPESTAVVGCWTGGVPNVTQIPDSRTWGGFGQWRLGMFDRLYLTLGIRGERNPTYGEQHKIDWTPTHGVTYTIDYGELSVKLLGSYGRATRAPAPTYRLDKTEDFSGTDHPRILTQFAAPELTPEYSRGPQGGVEVYYGNRGSFTVNWYRQAVSDLIQRVQIDSLLVTYLDGGYSYFVGQYQYQNVAKVEQHGVELTATANVSALTLKGVYSWNDSRVAEFNPKAQNATGYYKGMSFQYLPTHAGNVSLGYARGGSSVTFVANYIGSSARAANYNSLLYFQTCGWSRLNMYTDRRKCAGLDGVNAGYVKSNLAAAQRINGWASFTLNVTNLGNSYQSDLDVLSPALGRQTLLGMSVRYPFIR